MKPNLLSGLLKQGHKGRKAEVLVKSLKRTAGQIGKRAVQGGVKKLLGKAGATAAKLGVNPATIAKAAKVAKVAGSVASRVAPYAAGGKVGLAIGAGTLAAYGGYKAHQYIKKKGGLKNVVKSMGSSDKYKNKQRPMPMNKIGYSSGKSKM